ncbi:MAG: HmuY family protein [Bacteroidetes bacterium]|nr:HmuY family protein [Bacteroidota bacterium]
MKRALFLVLLPVIIISVTSCFKDDEKVVPHQPGSTKVDTIPLTVYYSNQVYFDLNSGASISTNLRKDWDLSFGSGKDGCCVRLNTSCFMFAAKISSESFGLPVDTTGAIWHFDNSNGNADSTAIGKWYTVVGKDTVSNGQLIILDRGIDELGNNRGLRQLVLDSLANDTYFFRIANLDGSNQQSYQVTRDPFSNHVLFSIGQVQENYAEPYTKSWDLLFSQYTTMLYTDQGTPYPYLVTGVLLNPDLVEVAIDSSNKFDSISFQTAKSLTYSNRQDFIGYNWKSYSFSNGVYTVRTNINYVIHDEEGFYFKFRFLGFYNNKGEKGYPSIEYQKL